MVIKPAKAEDKPQKNNDKYAAIIYYRLRNKIVILRRWTKNANLMGLKGRMEEAIKTSEMEFDVVGKEFLNIMRTGEWSKALIQKMEFINMTLQGFTMNIIEAIEDRKQAKDWHRRKPKEPEGFKTNSTGLKDLAKKTYSLVRTFIPEEIRSKFSTKQLKAVSALSEINERILEEVEIIKDKFDNYHKWSDIFPLMLRDFAELKIEFPTEFVVLRPWSINEYELPEETAESERLFKKLTNVTKKILSELKQIHLNQDLFMDQVPDQVGYSDVKEIVHLPIPKDCPSSDTKDISYPPYHEGFSGNPLIRIIDAHKELLYKVRCVRKSQFELEKVKHNICLKDDYLRLARNKYYDPYKKDEIKYFSYETWKDEPATPEKEEQMYNEHYEYYKDCKERDREERIYKAKRRKETKIYAVEQNKFIEQAWEEAKQEVKEHALYINAWDKLDKFKLGKYKLVKTGSSSKLENIKTYKEIPVVAKVADAASAGDTNIFKNNKKENIIKDEYNSENSNIIDINSTKKEELNKKKPHY